MTSRLNLWISKTQEPGAQDPQVPCSFLRPLTVDFSGGMTWVSGGLSRGHPLQAGRAMINCIWSAAERRCRLLPLMERRGLEIRALPGVLSPHLHPDAPSQEVQKESVAAKRTQWGRKAVSSLEAEVRGAGRGWAGSCHTLRPRAL